MREAMIVVPHHDNAGKSLQHVHKNAMQYMARHFGGCTSVNATGSWVSSSGQLITEPVWELTSAYAPSAENDDRLTGVARYVGTEGKQQAVYVRYASGDVRILDTLQSSKAA